MNAKNPWFHAKKAEREYITPEDVGDAYKAGATFASLSPIVLDAIGTKAVEDVSCTAFVTVDIPKRPKKRRRSTSAQPPVKP